MADHEYEHMCNDEPYGYCGDCSEPIEDHHPRFYDANGNLVCSEDCQREANHDIERDQQGKD